MRKPTKFKRVKKSESKVKNTKLRSLINPASCIGFGIVVFILLLLMFAFALVKSNISFKILPVFLVVAMLASSFISGFYSAKRLKLRGMVAGIAASLPIILFSIVCSFVINSGSVRPILFLVCLGCLVTGAIGGIFSANTRQSRRSIN